MRLHRTFDDEVPVDRFSSANQFAQRTDPFERAPEMLRAMHREIQNQVFSRECLDLRAGHCDSLQARHHFIGFQFEHKTLRCEPPMQIDYGEPIIAHELYLAMMREMRIQLRGS